jgi:hypothetical protein
MGSHFRKSPSISSIFFPSKTICHKKETFLQMDGLYYGTAIPR